MGSEELFRAFAEASGKLPQPDISLGEVIGWCFWSEPKVAL
ncbi:hypothetical protein [Haloferula sp. BvORR071]|nr:hypothetical protein [Haloferula sp. BvORR071]